MLSDYLKNKQTTYTCNNINKPQKGYVELEKTQKCMYCVSQFICIVQKQTKLTHNNLNRIVGFPEDVGRVLAKEQGRMSWGYVNVLYLGLGSSNLSVYLLKLSQLYNKDL